MRNTEQLWEAAARSIVDADEKLAVDLLEEARRAGLDPIDLLRFGFGEGNARIAESFEQGALSLPELLYSSEVMKSMTERIMAGLRDSLAPKGRILMATVEGDAHDIGKNIVVSTLRANGFEVIDLGREVPAPAIVQQAVEHEVDIIGTSALLTTTLQEQRKLEQLLREQGLRDRFYTMVGGAPCTLRWTRRIGADSYSEDAIDAVKQASKLMEQKAERRRKE